MQNLRLALRRPLPKRAQAATALHAQKQACRSVQAEAVAAVTEVRAQLLVRDAEAMDSVTVAQPQQMVPDHRVQVHVLVTIHMRPWQPCLREPLKLRLHLAT